MHKRTSRVAPSRRVCIHEDAENVGCKPANPMASIHRKFGNKKDGLRKPLADLGNPNSTMADKNTTITIKRCGTGERTAVTTEPQNKKRRCEETTLETDEPETRTARTEGLLIQHKEENPEASTTNLRAKEIIREHKQIVNSVPYYLKHIYDYLFALEDRFQIPNDHLEGQDFTGTMRAVLIDWLAGLIDHMDLLQETFQLTVYVMDKYMSIKKNTTKATAQLVGLSALFVAAKYEESGVIELTDLTTVCGLAWMEEDIKSMEREILRVIGYQLGRPLAIHFLRRMSTISGASPMEHCYAKYFADTSLLLYQLCHVKPSEIAAAALYLGLSICRNRIDKSLWTTELIASSGYNLEDLQLIIKLMARTVTGVDAGKLQGIKSSYSRSHLYCVSLMPGCQVGGIISRF